MPRENIQNSELSTRFEPAMTVNGSALFYTYKGQRTTPMQCWFCDKEGWLHCIRVEDNRWAEAQPNPKPSWLVPYDDLSEPDKEADRQIGETIARWTLIHDASRLSAIVDDPR